MMSYEELVEMLVLDVMSESNKVIEVTLSDEDSVTVCDALECVSTAFDSIVDEKLTEDFVWMHRHVLLSNEIWAAMLQVKEQVKQDVLANPQYLSNIESLKSSLEYPLLRRGKVTYNPQDPQEE